MLEGWDPEARMENLRNLRETGRRSPKAGDSCPKLVAEYMIVYHTKN